MRGMSAVLAEYDPAALRYLPFLSRRRRSAVAAINEHIKADSQAAGVNGLVIDGTKIAPFGEPVEKIIPRYSTRTLEMINSYFDATHGVETVNFLKAGANDELLIRAGLSYREVIESALTDDEDFSIRRYWSGLASVFRAAKSSDREFFRYQDLSAMEGELRTEFEALLIVLVSNLRSRRWDDSTYMSQRLANLIRSRPERAHDIVQYQRDRDLELKDMSASAVKEYLDGPVVSLNRGML